MDIATNGGMRALRGAAVALATCLALAGCQDDDTRPTPGRSGTPTSSPTTSADARATEASGPAIRGDVFTVNVPKGWKKETDFSTDFLDQYADPDSSQQMYVGELAGEVRPLDEVAKGNFDGFAPTGKDRRLETGDLAGEPAYHFTARDGAGNYTEEFVTVHDGTQVTLGMVLTGTRAERRAVVDSVLASWEWT